MDSRFIGSWALRSFTRTDAAGAVSHPYGVDVRGCIVYSSDGVVSYQLAARRQPFASGDFTRATAEELAAAAAAFRSYVAHWSVSGDSVTHRVFLSFHVDREGADLVRRFEFRRIGDDDALVLVPVGGASGVNEELVWLRMRPT